MALKHILSILSSIGSRVAWAYRESVRVVLKCQEAALTRRTSWRRSEGGVGLGPSGKQLYPATPELTAWQERLADSLQ